MKKTVLLTGATGFVGGQCRIHWGDRYNLRLADNRPMSEAKDGARKEGGGNTQLAANEEFVLLDITKYDDFLAACQGVDTVVHLAATPGAPDDPEGFYSKLLPLNLIGCYNAFQVDEGGAGTTPYPTLLVGLGNRYGWQTTASPSGRTALVYPRPLPPPAASASSSHPRSTQCSVGLERLGFRGLT
jgi:hypothetical protein